MLTFSDDFNTCTPSGTSKDKTHLVTPKGNFSFNCEYGKDDAYLLLTLGDVIVS